MLVEDPELHRSQRVYPRRTHGQGDHVHQAKARDARRGIPGVLAQPSSGSRDTAPRGAPLRPVAHAAVGLRARRPTYDGIAEVWADDTAALRAMTQSPA